MRTDYIVDHYVWAAVGSGTVVDVGGSHGDVSVGLAKRYPSIRCVVQDLPEVISGVKSPENGNLAERVTFDPYNFFTPQPVKDAEVYLFRMIFHNWGDKYCIRILHNLIPALKKGAKIVINDHVVPPSGVLSPYADRAICGFDWVMKEMFNAKERSIDDWKDLLQKADSRFRVMDVIRPEGSQLQIIEAVWEGEN